MAKFAKKVIGKGFRIGRKITARAMKIGGPMIISSGLALGQPEIVGLGMGISGVGSYLEK